MVVKILEFLNFNSSHNFNVFRMKSLILNYFNINLVKLPESITIVLVAVLISESFVEDVGNENNCHESHHEQINLTGTGRFVIVDILRIC